MDYSQMLSWLQSLIGGQQGINQSQFGQNLGLQQQQVTNQNNQFQSELANRLALQQGATQGQLAIQAPQLQTQRDLQSAELANRLGLQKNQLGEQGREFDISTGLTKQQQLWNQMMALNKMNYDRTLPLQQTAHDLSMSVLNNTMQKPVITYAGKNGSGVVNQNNPTQLMDYYRWANAW